jgi:hypothetical protein
VKPARQVNTKGNKEHYEEWFGFNAFAELPFTFNTLIFCLLPIPHDFALIGRVLLFGREPFPLLSLQTKVDAPE